MRRWLFGFSLRACGPRRRPRPRCLKSLLDKPERVPFAITPNPALRSISSIIRKHFHILISSPRCYSVFTAAPIVAYRRSSNLSDFLIWGLNFAISIHKASPGAHTYAEKTVSLVNTYLTDKLHTPALHATGETRLISHHIDSNSKNVIYMYIIQCNHRSKQYAAETKRWLKYRFNEHRRPVDNPSSISKPTTVLEHFLTNDHSANDFRPREDKGNREGIPHTHPIP